MKKKKNNSRTIYAVKNVVFNLLYQILNTVSNIIIPPLLINNFGSAINGLVSTIKQIINYIQIVGSGISESTTVALYKPLEEGDTKKVSEIYNASEKTFTKSGMIFCIIALATSFIYPLFLSEELDYFFIVKMVIILSISGASEFFAIGKIKTLLIADQKNYIINIVQIIALSFSTFFVYFLIKLDCNILIVQFISSLLYVFRIVLLYTYVRRHYTYLNNKEVPDYEAVSKRKPAMVHQIAGLITFGSQTLFIAKFCGLKEASVYSVYSLIFTGINTILSTFSSAMISGIGHLMNSDMQKKVNDVYSIYECCYYILVFTCYITAFSLCMPFIKIYTAGITDINYVRYNLMFLFTIMGLLNCLRTPGATIINAKGHYKETQNRAIIEMFICLFLEVIFVKKVGIVGILIATIFAYLYRTIDVIIYSNKIILKTKVSNTLKRITYDLLFSILLVYIFNSFTFKIHNYFSWVIYAIIIAFISFIFILIINLIFDKKTIINVKEYIYNIIRR